MPAPSEAAQRTAAARAVVTAYAAASAGWIGLLGVEGWRHGGGWRHAVQAIVEVAPAACVWTAVFGAPLLVLHGLARRARPPLPAAAAAALAVLPAYDQARFLTSGAGVSGHAWRWPLAAALFVALTLGLVALWTWHVAALRAGRRWRAAWLAPGVAGPIVLAVWAAPGLQAYAHFLGLLAWAGWVAVATLAWAAVAAGGGAGRWAATGTIVVALAAAVAQAVDPGAPVAGVDAPHAPLAAVVRGLAPAGDVPDFDLPAAAEEASRPGACDAPASQAPPASSPSGDPAAAPGHVILISLDAVRRDALHLDIDGRPVAPNLRAFAATALDYVRATAPYPATLFSLGGALTGLHPTRLAVTPHLPANLFALLRERLPRQLISFPDVRWFDLPVVRDLLVQGATLHLGRTTEDQMRWFTAALADARASGQPTLAWLHLYDAHDPHHHHPDFFFGPGPVGAYLSEVAFTDHQFAQALAGLAQQGWLADSLLIVFADHGEAMGERGHMGHHVHLNRWIADVPLLLRHPSIRPGAVEVAADLLDIPRTVLDHAGVAPPAAMGGRSLLRPDGWPADAFRVSEAFGVPGPALYGLRATPVADLAGLAARLDRLQGWSRSYSPKVALTTAGHRLLVDRGLGEVSLYDRLADPAESHDLAGAQPALAAHLLARLQDWHRAEARALACEVAP